MHLALGLPESIFQPARQTLLTTLDTQFIAAGIQCRPFGLLLATLMLALALGRTFDGASLCIGDTTLIYRISIVTPLFFIASLFAIKPFAATLSST